jgi:hypothetical protein
VLLLILSLRQQDVVLVPQAIDIVPIANATFWLDVRVPKQKANGLTFEILAGLG